MRSRRPRNARLWVLAVLAIAAPREPTWRGLVGGERVQVPVGQRVIVVLKTPSVAEHVKARRFATEVDERRWTAQALASQQQVLTMLAAHGLAGRPDYNFTRVLNGFSAPLDPRAIALLLREREVEGVYPVRIAYPASFSTKLLEGKEFGPGEGRRPDVELPGHDGRGVTVALLDTGVDRAQPYLRGRVLPGIDIVERSPAASRAGADPQDRSRLERHGTQLAGIVVGRGGPAGLHGVAPGASLLPIRVAGWQPDAEGTYAVYARSDQLIAGLDRAVDPNGDGLAGPSFGSLSGPGGAPAALTVAATDARAKTPSARLVLRRGLQVILDETEPLLGSVAPTHALNLGVGAPGGPRTPGAAGSGAGAGAGAKAVSFFDRNGASLVAGRAAFVPAGGDPVAAATAAVRAGAAAVVLYGKELPPGALGLADEIGVPVVTVDAGSAVALLAARDLGTSVGVSIAPHPDVANSDGGRIAAFSSRGLAYDGRIKPDVATAGVGLATSDPGVTDDGDPAFATVNGTSGAAAAVAGAAALLVQARPDVDARGVKSLLAGYARPDPDVSPIAGGTGALDVGASAVGEVIANTTSVGFGAWTGRAWTAKRTIAIRNVSTRRLSIGVTAREASGESEQLAFKVEPSHLVLRVGQSAKVVVTARAPSAPAAPVVTGAIHVAPDGGRVLRVPWSIAFRHYAGSLLARARLRDPKFEPSDTTPAVLEVQAGRLVEDQGVQVQPVARLDVLLYDASGRFIGVLARLRDLLPGSYTFGITGRDPGGQQLEPGPYELRLVAWPTLPGKPSRSLVRFEIE